LAGQILLLALYAALYPTLLAVVVILLAQARARRLLTVYLLGGMSVSIAAGLLVVFVLSQSSLLDQGESSGLSWKGDLTIGGLALLAAVALALRTDERMRERRRRRKGPKPEVRHKHEEPWARRILARGSTPLVFGAALVINLPGAAYLIALKDIAAGDDSSAVQVALVLGFNLIMFILAEVPLVGLWVAPERTNALVHRMNAWAARHGREVAIGMCVVFGVFLIVRGILSA
jgi:Sap-like sulfolipid-1-addressing protein